MQSTSLKSPRVHKEDIFLVDWIIDGVNEGTVYEGKYRRKKKNKKIISKTFLKDSESSSSVWIQRKPQTNWWKTSGAKCSISAICSEWLWMHHKKSFWKREKLKKQRRKIYQKEKEWKEYQWTHLRKRKDAWKSSLSVEKGHGKKW